MHCNAWCGAQCDLLHGAKRERLLLLADELYNEELFSECFMVGIRMHACSDVACVFQVSALKGKFIEPLRHELSGAAIEGRPWEFGAEQVQAGRI